jgi:hypothetical protein
MTRLTIRRGLLSFPSGYRLAARSNRPSKRRRIGDDMGRRDREGRGGRGEGHDRDRERGGLGGRVPGAEGPRNDEFRERFRERLDRIDERLDRLEERVERLSKR